MDVPAAHLDAQAAAVHLDGVEGAVFGADVALARERRHGDGVALLRQRQVVAERPVQEELRIQTSSVSSRPGSATCWSRSSRFSGSGGRKERPHLSAVGRRDEAAVDGEEAAAEQNLLDTTDRLEPERERGPRRMFPTWTSSSLLSNCDTSRLVPSASLVRDTQSLPEARRWASAGSLRRRESRTSRSRPKAGWRTPRGCLRALRARVSTSAQKPSEEHRQGQKGQLT